MSNKEQEIKKKFHYHQHSPPTFITYDNTTMTFTTLITTIPTTTQTTTPLDTNNKQIISQLKSQDYISNNNDNDKHDTATAHNDNINNSGDAIIRQKRRKTVMNTSHHHLAIEIHNEGLIILHRGGADDISTTDISKTSNKDDKGVVGEVNIGITKNKTRITKIGQATPLSLFGKNEDFIPWGVQATKILLSVVCGVVPNGYGCDVIAMDSASLSRQNSNNVLQGGQMKCIVTDMMTSDETAVYQRIQALKQVGLSTKITPKISELEKKLVIIQAELVDKQNAANKATVEKNKITALAKQEVEKADKVRRGLEDIKRKAAKYYNPDGTLNRNSTTPENIQNLVAAEAK